MKYHVIATQIFSEGVAQMNEFVSSRDVVSHCFCVDQSGGNIYYYWSIIYK
jgi:hypothetical protein